MWSAALTNNTETDFQPDWQAIPITVRKIKSRVTRTPGHGHGQNGTQSQSRPQNQNRPQHQDQDQDQRSTIHTRTHNKIEIQCRRGGHCPAPVRVGEAQVIAFLVVALGNQFDGDV